MDFSRKGTWLQLMCGRGTYRIHVSQELSLILSPKIIKSFAAFKSPFRGSGEYRSESDDTVEQLFPGLCPQIKGLPMMLKRKKEHNQPQLHKNIQY